MSARALAASVHRHAREDRVTKAEPDALIALCARYALEMHS
jgi:hypothetical protein